MHSHALRIALASIAMLFAACDAPTTEERCRTLDDYLDGRELDFDRSCLVDTDCSVVFVRPGTPLAVNGQPPDDPALRRVLDEYEASCGPLPRGTGAPFAVCEQRILESADPNDPTQAIFEVLDQVCVLRGPWTVEDVDAGADAGTDADAGEGSADGSGTPLECVCETDSDCGGDRCVACGCVPDTLCGDACAAADACDAVDALQLQQRGDLCAASCEVAVERSAAYEPFIDCLLGSPCASIVACGGLLP